MTLRIIGAGFGRTGTSSLKTALEDLGFAPCYHMLEVAARSEHSALWLAANRGERVDWHELDDGDEITVGAFRLYFLRVQDRAASSASGLKLAPGV